MNFNLSDLKLKPNAKNKTEVKIKIVQGHKE